MYFPPKPVRGVPGSDLHRNLIHDRRWRAEPKPNGKRCLAVFTEQGVELWTRHGRHFSHDWLGPVVDEFEKLDLPPGSIFDGELMCNPKPLAEMLVFDYPTVAGGLAERRNAMRRYIMRSGAIRVAPWWEKSTAFERAVDEGYEGVVFKRIDRPYEWQRGPQNCECADWVKFKPVKGP